MYLLDTVTLSASRHPDKAPPGLADWIVRTNPSQIYLSAISLLEVSVGARRLWRRDPRQADMLTRWILDLVLPEFSGRILAFDKTVALRCSTLHVPDPRPERDAMIAATALVHGLIVVTRNVRDFASMGVPIFNPWDYEAPHAE